MFFNFKRQPKNGSGSDRTIVLPEPSENADASVSKGPGSRPSGAHPFHEAAGALLGLADEVSGAYLLSQDPVAAGLGADTRRDYIRRALACGRAAGLADREAMRLAEAQTKTEEAAEAGAAAEGPFERALRAEGFTIREMTDTKTFDVVLFAEFSEPKNIYLYTNNLEAAQALADELGYPALSRVPIREIVLAHEAYHEREESRGLWTARERVTLWRFLAYQHRSPVSALSEIAAMAYAKALLDLDFFPGILDVLLVYPHSEARALEIRGEMLEAALP